MYRNAKSVQKHIYRLLWSHPDHPLHPLSQHSLPRFHFFYVGDISRVSYSLRCLNRYFVLAFPVKSIYAAAFDAAAAQLPVVNPYLIITKFPHASASINQTVNQRIAYGSCNIASTLSSDIYYVWHAGLHNKLLGCLHIDKAHRHTNYKCRLIYSFSIISYSSISAVGAFPIAKLQAFLSLMQTPCLLPRALSFSPLQ